MTSERAVAPPVILMGGADGNALSVARSLGRRGIPVYGLSDAPDLHSRYLRHLEVRAGLPHQEAWLRYLRGPESKALRGAVLLSCCDAGIELLVEHREELEGSYILDISNAEAQLCLLGKLSTYQKAVEAEVPTPRFWPAENGGQVREHRDDYVYPLIVKPLLSHKFQEVFNYKFFRATDYRELLDAYERTARHGLEVTLVEEIPGPDDLLCSYYTYLDAEGSALFDFTKRIIRRFPENRGPACYHVTDWIPEARDLGLRMFRHVGLQGLANVEFKRDPRDGRLKIIECNARFTAGNALLAASGYDLARFVYGRLVGAPCDELKGRPYATGLHYWFPDQDFRAFLALRRQGRLSLPEWLGSVAHPQVVPYLRWDDPVPSFVSLYLGGSRAAARAAGMVRGRT